MLRVLSSVQSLSRVRLFATPWIAACQASLSITNSRSSEPHAVLVTSHLAFIIINLLPDYGSLLHGWNHIQNPTIEKNYKVISDHKLSNVCVKNAHFIPKTATLRDAFQYVRVKPLQCPTVCDPMDCTVHGILQARILKRGAFPFSRGYSQPRDWTQVSHIAGGFYTSWATKEAPFYIGKAVLKKYLKSM